MARDLDERQQTELSAFVNALAEAAGYTTTAEWARDAGYPASNLSNLRNGRRAVDGYNLLRLIRAAAARAPEMTTEQLAVALARSTAADASEESVADRLEDLAAGVREALELLREVRDAQAVQPEAQQPGSAAPRTPKARRAAP